MLESALVLLSSAILVNVIFHYLRLPSVMAYIAAGMLVGPHGFTWVTSPLEVNVITEISAVLLMFTVGLEFSLKELTVFRRPILVLGLGQVFFTILLFTGIFMWAYGFPVERALFLSFLIAPSSTAIVLKLLSDHRDLETPYGRGALSILVLQDIAVIPMIVTIPFLVKMDSLSSSLIQSLFPLILLAILVITILYLTRKIILPVLLTRVAQTQNREIFFFTVLLLCLSLAALMHQVGLSYSLGAFIAGILLAGSRYGKQATAEIQPLRDSFLSLFFVAIGMMVDLKFVATHIHQIILIGTVIVIIKAAILFLVLWFSGSTSSVARAVTGLLFQFGEFALILAGLGVQHNLISAKEQQFVITIAIATIGLTPLIYRHLPRLLKEEKLDFIFPTPIRSYGRKLRNQFQKLFLPRVALEEIAESHELKDHVIIIGYGIAGQSLARVLIHFKVPFVILELNAETVRLYADQVPIIYGDASKRELLMKAGIANARLVAVVTSGINMLVPVVQSIRKINKDVRILARTNYLRDIKNLQNFTNVSCVVSELESTIEVIHEALREFHVESDGMDQIVQTLRRELKVQPKPTAQH